MYELIIEKRLYVCNKANNISTFCNTKGDESNIGVTLVSESLRDKVKGWRVLEEIISDHRIIEFEIMMGKGTQKRDKRNDMQVRKFNIKKADWRCLTWS